MAHKKIIVFGAQGRTGSLVVAEALKKGYEVSAFVYENNHSLPEDNQNLHIVEGDARKIESVKAACYGHSAVINIVAPRLNDRKNYDISEVATSNILQAMNDLGIRRYIGQSGAWATEFLSDASLPMRLGFLLVPMFRGIYFYKKQEDELIKQSELDWTIVRCGLLTDKPPQKSIKVFEKRYKCGLLEIPKISRHNVAKFHIAILDDQRTFQKCPIIIE
jgi:putative NADH-flavin reductase